MSINVFALTRDLLPHIYLHHDLASCEQASMTYKGHSGFHSKRIQLLSSNEILRYVILFPAGNNTRVAHLAKAIIENVEGKTSRPALAVRMLPLAVWRRRCCRRSCFKTKRFENQRILLTRKQCGWSSVQSLQGGHPGPESLQSPGAAASHSSQHH